MIVKYIFITIAFIAAFAGTASARVGSAPKNQYDYVSLLSGTSFETVALCPGYDIVISAESDEVVLAVNGYSVAIDRAEDIAPAEFIVGDFWGNGHCFIAVKFAESDVNESYAMYEMFPGASPAKVDSVPSLTNPDFKEGRVFSSYRDAARWHSETLCYSRRTGNPYVCDKRDTLSDTIERARSCIEHGQCGEPSLVLTGTNCPVMANVVSRRAYIFRQTTISIFSKGSSYLVGGDIIRLTDFNDEGSGLFYKFIFERGGEWTVAWIPAADVSMQSN